VAFQGFVDTIDNGILRGWAYDPIAQNSALVSFAIDGRVVAVQTGTEFRADLLEAQVGDGRHGFTWRLPDGAGSQSPAVVTARFADGTLLEGGERVVVRSGLAKSELFGGVLATGIWMPARIEVTAQRIAVEGWAIPPFAAPIPWSITHNGAPFAESAVFDDRAIAGRLGIPAGGACFGFRCEAPNPDPAEVEHEFGFADARTSRLFNPNHTMHYNAASAPLPEAAQRKRVSANEDVNAFFVVGASTYTRLDRVLQTFFGKSLAQADAVLDWGCGCGRVFRYFPPDRLSHFTGIDIDRDNIAWCKENFPAARFETVSPRPPTLLGAAQFDVVFGISVFTHLTEENHFEWLEELARITRPGAAVLVSVHGETAWMLSGFPLDRYAEWRSHGYLVAGKNFDLDDAYADTSLYVNSFISRRYVYENWSRYFRVVDVLAGAIGNFQDLVVLERT
jgi:Methyltransferase domain